MLFNTVCLTAQGISFNSSDQAIKNRTSYNVFEYRQPVFKNNFKIDFKLSIQDPDTFGYILNVKDLNNPISYSLVYVGNDEKYGQIKLNLEGVNTLITIPLIKEDLNSNSWIEISLNFDLLSKNIRLVINEDEVSIGENLFEDAIKPEINFGKHRSIIDVPSMAIKDLYIKNNKSIYFLVSMRVR